MSGISRFISSKPHAPIMAGAALGGLTPLLLKNILNKDKKKYNMKLWHPLLGVLLGTGLGTGATYLGTNLDDMLLNKEGRMYSDFQNFFGKIIKEAAIDKKIEIDNNKINISEFMERMQKKEQYGPDIKLDEVPIIESTNPIPDLYQDDKEQENLSDEASLINPIPDLYQDGEVQENPFDDIEASLTADIERESGTSLEEPEDIEEVKVAWNRYISGMEEYLDDLGFNNETDKEDIINRFFGA